MQAVRTHSRAELEARAHERYRQTHRPAPPPTVRNVDALLTLGRPRRILWHGRRYRVPPLSYAVGMRLLALRHAMDRPGGEGSAARLAARFLRRAMRVQGWRRMVAWMLGNPFHGLPPDELRRLLDRVLDVPDASPAPPPGGHATIDLVDGLMEFAAAFPALMRKGEPISWAHYSYGLRHIGRANARESLRMGQACRMAQLDKEAWREWADEQKAAAGW